MSRISYKTSAEKPDLQVWWSDDDDELVDFSSGYTFSLKVGQPGSTAVLTKTTGIVGAAGSGTPGAAGTPNLVVTWSAGELALTAGSYALEITATTGGLDRVAEFPFELRPVVL